MHYEEYSDDHSRAYYIFVAILLVLCAFVPLIWGYHTSHNYHTVVVTVTRAESIPSGKNGHKYLIYSTDEVYEVTDNFWNGRYNSSDLYNQLQQGGNFKCTAIGYRNGFFSWYENLLDCKIVRFE